MTEFLFRILKYLGKILKEQQILNKKKIQSVAKNDGGVGRGGGNGQ